MLLTITTTHRPATDLGFLLHKNPAGVHERGVGVRRGAGLLSGGDERAVHGCPHRRRRPGRVGARSARRARRAKASRWRSTSTTGRTSRRRSCRWRSRKMFGTAMSGRSKERPELAESALPFDRSATGRAVPRAARRSLRRLFEPLGLRGGRRADPARPDVPGLGRQPVPRRDAHARRLRVA